MKAKKRLVKVTYPNFINLALHLVGLGSHTLQTFCHSFVFLVGIATRLNKFAKIG